MITYEITATVEPHLTAAYEKYMAERHIPDLLGTGHFTAATFSKQENRYRIRYEAKSLDALSDYLKNEAPRLREDFFQHFPQGIELTRAHWQVISTFFPSDGTKPNR